MSRRSAFLCRNDGATVANHNALAKEPLHHTHQLTFMRLILHFTPFSSPPNKSSSFTVGVPFWIMWDIVRMWWAKETKSTIARFGETEFNFAKNQKGKERTRGEGSSLVSKLTKAHNLPDGRLFQDPPRTYGTQPRSDQARNHSHTSRKIPRWWHITHIPPSVSTHHTSQKFDSTVVTHNFAKLRVGHLERLIHFAADPWLSEIRNWPRKDMSQD